MRITKRLAMGLILALVVTTAWAGDSRKIAIRDDCDPTDPTFPAGGCLREEGDVSNAEFNVELSSPFSLCVIGHQAWRNDPNYLKIEAGDKVRVTNKGGRGHTFTKVAEFGGGRVPVAALNKGLTPAPECQNPATAPVLLPGESAEIKGLAVGNHRFQCCIHPWMRALVKVKAEDEEEEDSDD